MLSSLHHCSHHIKRCSNRTQRAQRRAYGWYDLSSQASRQEHEPRRKERQQMACSPRDAHTCESSSWSGGVAKVSRFSWWKSTCPTTYQSGALFEIPHMMWRELTCTQSTYYYGKNCENWREMITARIKEHDLFWLFQRTIMCFLCKLLLALMLQAQVH